MKTKIIFQEINRFIFGKNLFASLEKRILTLVAFVAFVISIIGNISNVILGFDYRVIVFTTVASCVLLVFFLSVRKAKDVSRIAVFFHLFCLLTIVFLWFSSGGYEGNTTSLAITCFIASYIVLVPSQKKYAAISIMLLLPGLIIIQYYFPGTVIPYDNQLQRFIDLSAGNFLYLVLIFSFLRIFMNNFTFEQKRTNLKNKLLDKLNTKLDEKNKEIIRQNELLKLSEDRYVSIFNNSPNVMFIHQDLRILLMNEIGLMLYGLTIEEVKGRSVLDFIPRDKHPEIIKRVQSRVVLGSREVYEITLQDSKGELKAYMVSSTLFLYEGHPASITTLIDITERKKAEEYKTRRSKFESELIGFSTELLSLNYPDEKLFTNLTEKIAVFFQASFVKIRFVESLKHFSPAQSYDYMQGQVFGELDFNMLMREVSIWYRKKENRGLILQSGNSGALNISELIDWKGLQSFLIAPLYEDNNFAGIIGVFSESPMVEWNDEESSILILVANLISNSLTRMRKQTESFNAESQYRAIFNSAGDAILIFEPIGETVLEVNEKALALYGFTRQEFIGMSLKSISENIQRGEFQIEKTRVQKEYHNFETMQYKKDGTPMYLLINAAVISFQGQEAIISINRDITEMKKAEQTLKTNEERLRLVLESTKDGIWDWRVDDSTTYFSPSYYRMLGYEPDEFPPSYEAWKSLVHPEDLYMADSVRFTNSDTSFYTTEFRMRTKTGEWIWVLNRAKVIERDAGGAPSRIVGNHTDITYKKVYEQQLHYARILISQIIDSIPSSIISLDKELRIRHANLAVEKMFGGDESHSVFLFQKYPRLYFINDLLENSLEANNRVQEVVTYHDDNKNLKYMDVLIIPLEELERNRVIVITDITERRKLEALVVQSEKMHSVSGLAAGMAHELNNPLGTISQGCQNLLRRIDYTFQKNIDVAVSLGLNLEPYHSYLVTRQIFEIITSMKTAAGRASDIISNMLKFSLRNNAVKTPFDFEKLFTMAIDIAYNDYDLVKKHDIMAISVIKEVQPNLPLIAISVPEIEQVLFNLIRNAMQTFQEKVFAADETPTIYLRAFVEDTYMRVEVEDNGPGISQENISHVFEPFFTTKNPGDGTGLGLSVCFTIITTNHGGQIFVESVKGQGAKFIFRLPIY
ncbi:MAG: PAS domain S-box protein [Ignavibacteriales bacterium]|nr:PAS domain S-box protein [Ignavibacteriales bacterium]